MLAASNVLSEFELGGPVAAIGNLMFAVSAVFTLVVAFMAWRKGGRAAGYFLLAKKWALLEAFTIAAALRLLTSDASDDDFCCTPALPLSMVMAAVLIALGVADRLRAQRRALSEAERRAETDPLTGVLNRRSLVERLERHVPASAGARHADRAAVSSTSITSSRSTIRTGISPGDACLAGMVAPIQAELRKSDVIVAASGGEEFIVILEQRERVGGAHDRGANPRARGAGVRVEGYGPPIRPTCSIGVAASDTLGVWEQHLIARADGAVYAAKRSGRNLVVQMAESRRRLDCSAWAQRRWRPLGRAAIEDFLSRTAACIMFLKFPPIECRIESHARALVPRTSTPCANRWKEEKSN